MEIIKKSILQLDDNGNYNISSYSCNLNSCNNDCRDTRTACAGDGICPDLTP